MAGTYKLNIPAPVSKESVTFAQALKACIATSAYGVEVDTAKGTSAGGAGHLPDFNG